MQNLSLWSVVTIILLFIFLAAFFASQLEVNLPYSGDSQSVLSYIWDTFADWINPF